MSEFATARRQMVETQLRTRNVTDRRLLQAMLEVPRERFVPPQRQNLAYTDVNHALGGASGRVLPSPVAFARLVQLAEIEAGDVVLDIACGRGYSAAVLAHIAGAVVAVESDAELVAAADSVIAELEIGNAAVLKTDLLAGVPSEAPFDAIVVEGTVEYVPDTLFDQLREGGRLVASMRQGRTAIATIFVKTGGKMTFRQAFDSAMPDLPAFALPPVFAL